MGRLHGVVLLTSEPDAQREFYEQRLGLATAHAEAGWVALGTQGAALTLQRAGAGEAAEVRLALTAAPLDARLDALRARGVVVEAGPLDTPLCRLAIVRDPEGNRVQLVEGARDFSGGIGPTLSHVIVNAAKFDETVAFYREVLGLKVAEESEFWVEFDTGATRLAVHDRADDTSIVLHPGQSVTFALEDPDFDAWADELRGRGVSFAAAPGEDALGVQAEVEDADGWFVVLHGPAPEEEFDEDLVSSYEDEYGDGDDDHRGLRRGGELASDPSRRGGFNPAKQARKQAAKSGGKSYEALQKGGAADTGGFVGRPRPAFGPPRPAGGPPRPFSPRPPGPGGAPGAPRPFTPRPPRPPRPDRDRG